MFLVMTHTYLGFGCFLNDLAIEKLIHSTIQMQHNNHNKKNSNAYKTLNRSRFLIFAFDTHVLQKNNEQDLQELEELKELFITIYRLRYKRRRDASAVNLSLSPSHCQSVCPSVCLSVPVSAVSDVSAARGTSSMTKTAGRSTLW